MSESLEIEFEDNLETDRQVQEPAAKGGVESSFANSSLDWR